MSKRSNIVDAMREVGGSTRLDATTPDITPPRRESPPISAGQTSRAGTKAITAHYPPAVRQQLKLLAVEQDRTMEDMLAEGLNLLFRAYKKPAIAPATRDVGP